MTIDKKKLRARIDDLSKLELKTLMKMIGGKLSRRKITAEQQADLQTACRLARERKVK